MVEERLWDSPNKRILLNEGHLWHVIFMLDRAAIMGFWFVYEAQESSAKAKLKHDSRDSLSLIGLTPPSLNHPDAVSHMRAYTHLQRDFSPTPCGDTGERHWDRDCNNGLIKLHHVYPGVQTILFHCLEWSKFTQVWLCGKGHCFCWHCFSWPGVRSSCPHVMTQQSTIIIMYIMHATPFTCIPRLDWSPASLQARTLQEEKPREWEYAGSSKSDTHCRLSYYTLNKCSMSPRSPRFQEAAAVRVTVHLLRAAARSFFSLWRMPFLNSKDVDNPEELVSVVLDDAIQMADGWLQNFKPDEVSSDGDQISDWQVRERACDCATRASPFSKRLLSGSEQWLVLMLVL